MSLPNIQAQPPARELRFAAMSDGSFLVRFPADLQVQRCAS
jgi:hypothetical protein